MKKLVIEGRNQPRSLNSTIVAEEIKGSVRKWLVGDQSEEGKLSSNRSGKPGTEEPLPIFPKMVRLRWISAMMRENEQ
jgi:hypothetical protein